MEPVTHFLFGACMGRAGLNRKTALATAATTLAAEAPDIDIVWYAGGPVVGFEHHRGFTHSFLGTPLIAVLVLAMLYGFHRWRKRRRESQGKPVPEPRWGLLLLFAWLAAMSHILLDFTNNYGVRPFMPLSYQWYAWDIVFIIEPLLYLCLLGGLLLPGLFGLVTSEIGYRAKAPRGRLGAIFGLAGVLLVWGVRDYEHRRALAAMSAVTYLGADPIRIAAFPHMVNPFKWYGVVEIEDAYLRMTVDSWTPEVDPQGRMSVRYKPEESAASLAAKKTYLGRVYLDWARFPVIEVEPQPPGAGYVVRFRDLRFLYPERRRENVLGASVVLDSELNVVAERFGMRTQSRRLTGGEGASDNDK